MAFEKQKQQALATRAANAPADISAMSPDQMRDEIAFSRREIAQLRAANIATLGDGEVFVKRDANNNLMRAFRASVSLTYRKGHIYSVDYVEKNGVLFDHAATKTWNLQSDGYHELNRLAGVTVVSISDPKVEYRNENPVRVQLDRLAFGYNQVGTMKVATVQVSLDAHHYRLQQINSAGKKWSRERNEFEFNPGFRLGPEPQLRALGLLDEKAGKLFVPVEDFGEFRVGWAVDFAEPAVRKVFSEGSEFYKSFMRRCITIADRLVSARWWGLRRLDSSWLRKEGNDIIARVPVYGWRADIDKSEIDAVAKAAADGIDAAEALRQHAGVEKVERVAVPDLPTQEEDATIDAEYEATSEPADDTPDLEGIRSEVLAVFQGDDALQADLATEGIAGFTSLDEVRKSSDADALSSLLAAVQPAA